MHLHRPQSSFLQWKGLCRGEDDQAVSNPDAQILEERLKPPFTIDSL